MSQNAEKRNLKLQKDAKEQTIRISALDFRGSTCDGPGIRNVVFFQGCNRHCPGCHNAGTWDPEGGYEISVADLVEQIEKQTPKKHITISGGEPLLQKKGLLTLVRLLRQKGFDIAVYTGHSLKEVPARLLKLLNSIKVGDFRINDRTTVKPYVGSTNQEFIILHNFI